MIKNTISKAIQTLAFLIPVVLERGRMKVTDDAGDVNIRALEDLARQGRPEIGLLTIPESLELYQPAVCDKPQSPVLLFPTEDVDETYGLMVNMKITTPSSSNDSTRQSEFVFLLSIQVNVIRGPCLGDRVAGLEGRSRRRSLKRKSRGFPSWRAGTTGGTTITFSSMSVSLRRAAGGASASHDPRGDARVQNRKLRKWRRSGSRSKVM